MNNLSPNNLIIWIDEEPNLLYMEMYDLESNGYTVKDFTYADEALEWLVDNEDIVKSAKALVIDVLMPSLDDARFISHRGDPVSVMLCKNLKELDIWSALSKKIIFYTRLPGGEAFQRAKIFCEQNKLKLLRKKMDSRIAMELLKENLID